MRFPQTVRRTALLLALALATLWPAAGPAAGEVRKFTLRQKGTRNLGLWRLTDDGAIRDEANYHNIRCFSPNGRYVCYTHWGGNGQPGGKGSAEIHIVDLLTGKDRRVDKGIYPRWGNNHNWLFYCHWTGNGKPSTETGSQIIRYDADTGKKVVITYGVENVGGLDSTDTWLYGSQRFRGRKPEHTPVRVRNRPNSKFEILRGMPPSGMIHLNPRYPVIMIRTFSGWEKDRVYHPQRTMYDLDGSNPRTGFVWAEMGHACWSGDGRYLLNGNKQVCGRLWNNPYPSDPEILSWEDTGDISPSDQAGRYLCGADLKLFDTRSGDAWHVVNSLSQIIYPMAGDNSTGMDIDPKGSPDGTKIHFHSTRDLENLRTTEITKYDPKAPDVMHVASTRGFPDRGCFVRGSEVVGYTSKTPTAFRGLTRRKYGTRKAKRFGYPGSLVLPLSAFVLSGRDKARAKPELPMVRAGFPTSHPLMYQRQTDCYIVVVRLPFRPHLRRTAKRVELIPGEHHWETRGYRILKDGRPLAKDLAKAGGAFSLSQPGSYTAVAVEWSGLESPPSLPLKITSPVKGSVLADKPDDFSRTREQWRVAGKAVARRAALAAPQADMELMHLHDGLIAREHWKSGKRISRLDLNEQGKPIRFQLFRNGKRLQQVYRNPAGHLLSKELYGADGRKTEYIRYWTRPGDRGKVYEQWWYHHGRPLKRTKRGNVIFDKTARSGDAAKR
ncbi:MAG: hypothetical protein QF577_05165 [Phycisphaerae bacterium]|nr:hypothetical protein [Phycisphaerae bacterium]